MSPNRQSAPWMVRVISPVSDNLRPIRATSRIRTSPFLSSVLFCPTTFGWVAWCHTNGLLCWCGSSDVEYLFIFPPASRVRCLLVTPTAGGISYSGTYHRGTHTGIFFPWIGTLGCRIRKDSCLSDLIDVGPVRIFYVEINICINCLHYLAPTDLRF